MSHKKIEGTTEAWESGQLGQEAKYARPAPAAIQQAVDESLGMQAISIRLHNELIMHFKVIAKFRGVGYQPLMRDALQRFADSEMKLMAIEYANLKAQEEKSAAECVDRKKAA